MTDENLEHSLRQLPAPGLPAHWREEILREARQAVRASSRPSTWPSLLLYLRQLFARNPVTGGALAATWLVIFVFHVTTPVDPSEQLLIAQFKTSPPPTDFLSVSQEVALLDQVENPSVEQPRPLRP